MRPKALVANRLALGSEARSDILLRQLLQHLPRLRVIGMLFEKFQQDGPSLFRRVLEVNPGEIQVRLIKGGRNADALFETCDRFVPPPGAKVKHSEVVQRLGIPGTKLQRSSQVLISTSLSSSCARTIPRL